MERRRWRGEEPAAAAGGYATKLRERDAARQQMTRWELEKETARNTKEAGENKRRREARRRAARTRRRREEARPPPPPVRKGPQEDGCGLRPESECGG